MLSNDRNKEDEKQVEAFCQHCGKLIAQQPYIAMGKTYCSEHCLLKTKDVCARQEDMLNLLAETLEAVWKLLFYAKRLNIMRVMAM